jgi:hypothetical protein
MTKLKYLMCPSKISSLMGNVLNEAPARGGLYNWLQVFKGDMKAYDTVEDFEKYDVVQVNLAPVDMNYVHEIRDKLGKSSSTKLVLNNDYVVEAWGSWQLHPRYWEHVQKQADMLFATHPMQQAHMIDKTKWIPHPTNIKYISKIGVDQNVHRVGFMYHWWEGKSFTNGTIAKRLKEWDRKLSSKLYGYRQGVDENKRFVDSMFDEYDMGKGYYDYITDFAKNQVVVENSTCQTYGRTSVDTAAIGVPTAGSERVFSMKHCFPQTSHNPYDVKSLTASIKKLITDEKFRESVIKEAREKVEFFNYTNSKERYMEALEESDKE